MLLRLLRLRNVGNLPLQKIILSPGESNPISLKLVKFSSFKFDVLAGRQPAFVLRI